MQECMRCYPAGKLEQVQNRYYTPLYKTTQFEQQYAITPKRFLATNKKIFFEAYSPNVAIFLLRYDEPDEPSLFGAVLRT